MQGLRMQEQRITVTDRDCCFDELGDELPITICTENEVQVAIQIGALTPDHCVWMHVNQMSWQVEVRL